MNATADMQETLRPRTDTPLVLIRDRLLPLFEQEQSRLMKIHLRAMLIGLKDIKRLYDLDKELSRTPPVYTDDVSASSDASKFQGHRYFFDHQTAGGNLLLKTLGVPATIEDLYRQSGYHMVDCQGIPTDIDGVSVFLAGTSSNYVIGLQFTREVKQEIADMPGFSLPDLSFP